MWVETTFDKEYVSGSTALFAKISVAEHGVKVNHVFGMQTVVYGNMVAYLADKSAERTRRLIVGTNE